VEYAGCPGHLLPYARFRHDGHRLRCFEGMQDGNMPMVVRRPFTLPRCRPVDPMGIRVLLLSGGAMAIAPSLSFVAVWAVASMVS
jgi:hypothetical protein